MERIKIVNNFNLIVAINFIEGHLAQKLHYNPTQKPSTQPTSDRVIVLGGIWCMDQLNLTSISDQNHDTGWL